MKKIDKLILGPFLRMLALTFGIILFVLLMQFFLIYFDELVGKGLSWGVYTQLSSYIVLSATREAFPLAILIASIISLGSLGEHFELTAIKSAGISLPRVLLPMIVFVSLLSASVLFCNSYLVPRSNLKLLNLLYDMSRKKPTLSIKEGIFYDGIPGYSIKVSKKLPDQKTLQGIMIYDHTDEQGKVSLATAETGILYTIQDEAYLVLELFDGYNYLEEPPQEALTEDDEPMAPKLYRSSFKAQKLIISLASFKLSRTKQELFASFTKAKNIRQLRAEARSMQGDIRVAIQQLKNDFQMRFSLPTSEDQEPITLPAAANILNLKAHLAQKHVDNTSDFPADTATPYQRKDTASTFQKALDHAKGFHEKLKSQSEDIQLLQKSIYSYELERHAMIALAVNCLLVLLIGAPLGALVKKGGLSIPIIIAVFLVVLYYVVAVTAEKWASVGFISPFLGAWAGNLISMPFCL
ncbi:MAG: LptF/LptG family permease, partial [Bacteroidota bacterium]